MITAERALELSGLDVRLAAGDAIVERIDLQLDAGEIVGLVGESGSGKTTTALALLGYCGSGVRISDGVLAIAGMPLRMDESMRSARGSVISYVPQDPGRALNPSLRIVDALRDVIAAHRPPVHADDPVVRRLFEAVGLPSSREFLRRFPHQLSGGQQQRVSIALALSCDPTVIVLDEPTTGLDVVTQGKILQELRRLRDEQGVAMVYVTHDLAVVAQIADRIAVMYGGRIVEQGPASVVLGRPRHPYTRGLLASIPDHVRPRLLEAMPGIAVGVGERPHGCAFAPRCAQMTEECVTEVPQLYDVAFSQQVRCVHWQATPVPDSRALEVLTDSGGTQALAPAPMPPVLEVEDLSAVYGSRHAPVVAASHVSFALARGSCLALVGESGSGKTTIVRAIAGLHPASAGRIRLCHEDLPGLARERTVDQRRRIQLIFQNPTGALNPRHTVSDTISRPAQVLRGIPKAALHEEVESLLEAVRLPSRVAERYPSELSGGERQRVAVARALAAYPEVILCDEITSALDVSVQAAVLKLLNDLRARLGVSLLFITHDLGVVANVADDVLVLQSGQVREQGPTGAVLKTPRHAYTQQLLSAAPSVAHVSDSRRSSAEAGVAE